MKKCDQTAQILIYCKFFVENNMNEIESNQLYDKNVSKYVQTHSKHLKRTSTAFESDMVDKWQHYLLYHKEESINKKCVKDMKCPFEKSKNNRIHHYRRGSWNVQQTMHVYFYHTTEYMQSRNSSERKHRFIRQRDCYRIRKPNTPVTATGVNGVGGGANIKRAHLLPALTNATNYSYSVAVQQSQTNHVSDVITDPDSDDDDNKQQNSNINDIKVIKHSGPGWNDNNQVVDVDNDNKDDDKDNDDSDDDDLDIISPNIDKYDIRYSTTTDPSIRSSLRVLEFGSPFVVTLKDSKFRNPKEEILQNDIVPLQKSEWNALLKACILYVRRKEAKRNGLNLKEIVALKLYTDFDALQREYRKCFREQFSLGLRINRQKQFYHWNVLLIKACYKSRDIITSKLYHGVNDRLNITSYSGTYYGPVSTTTVFDISKQFAGSKGRIFELYPTFGRKGLKVSWLSNFPDEGEVLYMNTSFQIANVYDVNTFDHDLIISNNNNQLFELSILKALHVINTESQIISFSDMNDVSLFSSENLEFHKLEQHEQIAILSLLYLQYRQKDWLKFWNKMPKYKRAAFAHYRDQFIVLAKNVKAVKMERLPMLLQHFFYEKQTKYKFPITSDNDDDIKECIDEISKNFKPFQPLRFETIIRLFPNAQQLLINGDNFDWTLNHLIKFMNKYPNDCFKLQEIDIRFIPQYPTSNNNNNNNFDGDEIEATKRLNKSKSHNNITKLRKLGWIFETSSRLRRVGFEPLEEPPFLFTFAPVTDDELFYKTYSRKILGRAAICSGKIGRMRANTYTNSHVSHDGGMHISDAHISGSYESYTLDGNVGGGGRISVGYKRASTSAVIPGASNFVNSPLSLATLNEEKKYDNDDNNNRMSNIGTTTIFPFNSITTLNSPLPLLDNNINRNSMSMNALSPLLNKQTSSDNDDQKQSFLPLNLRIPSVTPTISISVTSTSTSGGRSISTVFSLSPSELYNLPKPILETFEGQNPLILNYNPKNCILSETMLSKLDYRDKLIKILKWRKLQPKLLKPNDKIKKKFIQHGLKIEVLVLDPMDTDISNIFMEQLPTGKTPIISLDTIYKLFPNITDIFLRSTQLNLRFCYQIKKFIEKHKNTKLERLYFSKINPIKKQQIITVQNILINWGGFKESEQMIVKNNND